LIVLGAGKSDKNGFDGVGSSVRGMEKISRLKNGEIELQRAFIQCDHRGRIQLSLTAKATDCCP
jgi:hypothetical protein